MIDYDNTIVGKQVRYYREKNNLSQINLAKLVGISASYLSDIEKGGKSENSTVSMKIICKIAEVLNVTIDILADTNIEYPKSNSGNKLLNTIEKEIDCLSLEELTMFNGIIEIMTGKSKKL